MTFERCCECDCRTGRGGREDSLYCWQCGKGPLCVVCFDHVHIHAAGMFDSVAEWTECYCHDGHKSHDTVCGFCIAKGRRRWSDPKKIPPDDEE